VECKPLDLRPEKSERCLTQKKGSNRSTEPFVVKWPQRENMQSWKWEQQNRCGCIFIDVKHTNRLQLQQIHINYISLSQSHFQVNANQSGRQVSLLRWLLTCYGLQNWEKYVPLMEWHWLLTGWLVSTQVSLSCKATSLPWSTSTFAD